MQSIWPDLNFMCWDKKMGAPSKEMAVTLFPYPSCGRERGLRLRQSEKRLRRDKGPCDGGLGL